MVAKPRTQHQLDRNCRRLLALNDAGGLDLVRAWIMAPPLTWSVEATDTPPANGEREGR